jgi:hypothetical protein
MSQSTNEFRGRPGTKDQTQLSMKSLEVESSNEAVPLSMKDKPFSSFLWKGKNEFFLSQAKIAIVLVIAKIGDKWEPSYHRNENHNMPLFFMSLFVLAIASCCTWKHTPPRDNSKVIPLSRDQTEEWKGWMQFAFIMYHYYRAFSAYNWIRVFVSSYVWMTGFGNFLYFDKKRDFSIERIVSMWIRINYFPLILSWATGVSLDLYYVVPLHTAGFFITLITCRLAVFLESKHISYWNSRLTAIGLCLVAHILFYETPAVDTLKYFSEEIHFRFQADKYSAWAGILSGLFMRKATEYMTWAHGSTESLTAVWTQRALGVILIATWYLSFGYLEDKHDYNPIHPYIFMLPLLGWLMIRNSSRYLTECHSTFLEYLGRNTLETYVLQFHVFMNHSVQHIPVVIPGSGAEGPIVMKTANMLLCGVGFVFLSVWARKITVSTQIAVTELVKTLSAPKVNYVPVQTKEKENLGFDKEGQEIEKV